MFLLGGRGLPTALDQPTNGSEQDHPSQLSPAAASVTALLTLRQGGGQQDVLPLRALGADGVQYRGHGLLETQIQDPENESQVGQSPGYERPRRLPKTRVRETSASADNGTSTSALHGPEGLGK